MGEPFAPWVALFRCFICGGESGWLLASIGEGEQLAGGAICGQVLLGLPRVTTWFVRGWGAGWLLTGIGEKGGQPGGCLRLGTPWAASCHCLDCGQGGAGGQLSAGIEEGSHWPGKLF